MVLIERETRNKYDDETAQLLLKRKLYQDQDLTVKRGLQGIREGNEEEIETASVAAKKLVPKLERRENYVRKKINELTAFENRFHLLRGTIERSGKKQTKEQTKELRYLKP
jgi:hypothetical protein